MFTEKKNSWKQNTPLSFKRSISVILDFVKKKDFQKAYSSLEELENLIKIEKEEKIKKASKKEEIERIQKEDSKKETKLKILKNKVVKTEQRIKKIEEMKLKKEEERKIKETELQRKKDALLRKNNEKKKNLFTFFSINKEKKENLAEKEADLKKEKEALLEEKKRKTEEKNKILQEIKLKKEEERKIKETELQKKKDTLLEEKKRKQEEKDKILQEMKLKKEEERKIKEAELQKKKDTLLQEKKRKQEEKDKSMQGVKEKKKDKTQSFFNKTLEKLKKQRTEVKDLDDALFLIIVLIRKKDFIWAYKAINEIKEKESKILEETLENEKNEKQKEKIKIFYKKNQEKINKIERKLKKEEEKNRKNRLHIEKKLKSEKESQEKNKKTNTSEEIEITIEKDEQKKEEAKTNILEKKKWSIGISKKSREKSEEIEKKEKEDQSNFHIKKEEEKKENETKKIKKEINSNKIYNFSDALSAIKIYILTEEWEKARESIKEIRRKEKYALDSFIKIIDDDKKKIEEKKKFDKNEEEIKKIELKLRIEEEKYNEKVLAKKFKIKFKKIREEINLLSKTGKNREALSLLTNFVEANKDNFIVIQFFNREKKTLQKKIEKDRKKEEAKLKKDSRLEAEKLIGRTMNRVEEKTEEKKEKQKKKNKIKEFFETYKLIKEKRRRKKLVDEVTTLIESEKQAKVEIAKSKLEKVHQGLIKELSVNNIAWYDFYGKILGAEKISGDTFGFSEDKEKYNFFLGDATGHGVRAGLIVSLLSRLFNRYSVGYKLNKMVFEINNWLKQDLQSRNFITGIFFEVEKENPWIIKFVWMGHEPMLIYRAKEKKVEKLIPWGLAAWIRIMKDESSVKVKEIPLENNDILICYSDGLVESRNTESEQYWIDRVQLTFEEIAQTETQINKIYDRISESVKKFKGGANFNDDMTIVIIKRDEQKDIIKEKDDYLKEVIEKEWLSKTMIKKMSWKSKEEIDEEIEKIKKEKQLKNIIKVLEWYYYSGEILTLKQEAIRFIKDGFIDPKINKFLKLAIANEQKYKISQKNKKMENKYLVLKELMKRWEYASVIKECNEIIAKDGNI